MDGIGVCLGYTVSSEVNPGRNGGGGRNSREAFPQQGTWTSVTHVALRPGVRVEISQSWGRSVGLVALDLAKCSEYVMRHILGAQCILAGCPMHELRATLVSYGWKRHLVLGASISGGLEAFKGIIAGCGSNNAAENGIWSLPSAN